MWKLDRDNKETKELRMVFVETLQDMMKTNDKVIALEADLGGASGFTKIEKSNPDRFINVGIAEANMAGISAGLSMRGFVPFMHTFAPFATRRIYDQLYLAGGYSHNTINIYGSDPGVCVAVNGGTHTSFEDVALMRALPNSWVLDPADATQLEWCIREVAKRKGVNYIRANRKPVENLYAKGSTFEIGKGNIIKEGKDVLLISCGEILITALQAAEELEKEGISVEVVDMFSIKPLDSELVAKEAANKKAVVTFENHNIIGGLGSAVAEVLSDNGIGVKLKRVGINDQFGQVGTIDYLKEAYGLTVQNLKTKIKETLK